MPLVEAVTIEVGAAIAKSILKLWVKDSSLGDDISSSLIDLFKSKTSDALAQRRGQRQFETIGEKVGESLLPLFEIEGARLDEGSRTAVALAVAEAFNRSKLSSDLLAERNLEPTKLAKHVLSAYPTATQLFSGAETAFYQRIIEESCAYIVDIASQLPAFTEHTFAEVLKREDQLILRTNEVLQELHRIREQLNPMADAGRFEISYRDAVARNLDVLQLLGLDVSSANRRHRLSVAYITLSVEQLTPTRPENKESCQTVTNRPPEGSQDEIEKDRVSVDIALTRASRLLIRGLAGSGKTTLLQWIAVKSATKSFEGQLSDWNDTIPFFIRLRQCIQSGLPRPEAFPGLVDPAIAGRMPEGWVHAQLESGRAIVLIDGMDEVSASQRENVRIWLDDMAETYPKARFMITSRPHAVEEGWLNGEGFSDAELQPMELSDIYMRIERWHKAMREALHEDAEKAELEPLAEHLKEEVRSNRSIRTLATNPLMCAMLCTLNRDRRRQLPADRIELYEACCYLLLERRDKARGVDLTDYPALNYRQKHLLLEDLAYWMIKNERSEAALELVDERFARKLTNMPNIAQDVSGPGVRRLFVERAGIIREPVTGQIDFTHRTFQEFLAAKAASDEMDTGILVANAHNDQWREVIILASGLSTKQMREELIKGLIVRGDTDKQHRYQIHLLAVSCLETSLELGKDVITEVEKCLSQLVPPKNMTDAKALAAAGELAVKSLAKKRLYIATTTAACVRTLALIGSDAALEMLEKYANDTRSTVTNELLRAWDSFDRETFARRVLSQTFRNRPGLYLEHLSSLHAIQYFTSTKLTSLTLSNCSQVRDLTPLANLTQLTSLTLRDCAQVSDLSPLANLTQLTSLTLRDCAQVSDLSPLANLTQLTSLNLRNCAQVSDLSPLANLTQLTLTLWGYDQVSDLSPLANLTQLTLTLWGYAQVSDLSPLANLTQLTSLNLRNCAQVSDLSPLANLTQLTSLILRDCAQVSDLSPLANLTQLTSLTLRNCAQVSDLSALAGLNSLRELELFGISNKLTIPQSIKESVKVIDFR